MAASKVGAVATVVETWAAEALAETMAMGHLDEVVAAWAKVDEAVLARTAAARVEPVAAPADETAGTNLYTQRLAVPNLGCPQGRAAG